MPCKLCPGISGEPCSAVSMSVPSKAEPEYGSLGKESSQGGNYGRQAPSQPLAAGRRFGELTPPLRSSQSPLLLLRTSFSRSRSDFHKNGLDSSSSPPLAAARMTVPAKHHHRNEALVVPVAFIGLDFSIADLRAPPSDHPDFKVCCSPRLDAPVDRWDSALEPPAPVTMMDEMGGQAAGRGTGKDHRGQRCAGAAPEDHGCCRGGCHGERDNCWDHWAAVGFRNNLGF
ncbi:hypothetical protein GQ457_02G003110 [Hibiscus cannabinus]